MNDIHLLPLFKWTGGKRREIKILKEFFPNFVSHHQQYDFVEPFAGGAAVYWYLNNVDGGNRINDYDEELVNFYAMMREQDDEFITPILQASALYSSEYSNHDKQEENYYYWRNLDKDNGLDNLSQQKRAARFWIVNQLSFSGMRRFNSKGEFNVPYGHYKNLNSNNITSQAHVNLLKKTIITHGDYLSTLDVSDNENTFIFLDPPYTRVMKKYSSDNEFTEKDHINLRNKLLSMEHASWMLVINQSDFIEELYNGYISQIYSLKYGLNIRNRFDTDVHHLIISNYLPAIG